MMEPTVRITCTVTTAVPRLSAPARTLFPPPGSPGIALFHHQEVPENAAGLLSVRDTIVLANRHLKNRSAHTRLEFEDHARAGRAGRKLHLFVTSLDPSGYLRLTPPGLKGSIPIRIPDGLRLTRNDAFWLTVSLEGALAERTGTWQGHHDRAFEDLSRFCMIIDRILAESPQ